MLILEITVTIILIEAITNILSKSDLFLPIKEFLFNRRGNKLFKFMHSVMDCPYCLSVWVSFACSMMLYLYLNNLIPIIFIWACGAIILHRLSNILHFLIDCVDRLGNKGLIGYIEKENDI